MSAPPSLPIESPADLDAALLACRMSDRRVLALFYMQHCPYCQEPLRNFKSAALQSDGPRDAFFVHVECSEMKPFWKRVCGSSTFPATATFEPGSGARLVHTDRSTEAFVREAGRE